MATVTYDKATRIYPGSDKPAVDQLDIAIEDGEFLVLVGPSGCGKSTSLRMLAGLEDVNGGAIRIGDRDVTNLPPKDRDIAMVFQNYALYPHMTVAQNMGFALKIAGVNKSEIRQKVEDAAKILDLTEYLDRKPKALSGGQRQRVAMGRAIVREPQVFLMDEPLSNLDAKLRVQTRTQIAGLQRRLGITTVYVTHDQVEAMTMGDRVAVLKDGLLQQIDSPRRMYDRPANLFVAGFIGSPAMNLVEVPIADGGVKFGNTVVPVSREALTAAADRGDRTVTVGVRPEHFDVVEAGGGLSKGEGSDGPAGLAITVNVVEELGADGYVYGSAEVGGAPQDLVVRVGGRDVPEKGSRIHVVPRAGETHVFSTSTGERLSD
ncbi:sn-glycerol-3-phosphate ABC transporter ATP-binding protein UgpC [Streptomyces sp. B1866]|uniref:ABC transporter ATP-binding protein n=1 Tax=Streptomyces sp. B1866 TaxID=3075431 RepID=UPI00289260BE|nr:sn-glycerol-3-phosphate ABC transporter ATP-binding protein UgpC [Streptomyces sp. B1866]MDT3399429.1 sn-glycerol-3-phosphate ABC transporter ATP-binding protein UgpC [Streptomyces sp. B1866]